MSPAPAGACAPRPTTARSTSASPAAARHRRASPRACPAPRTGPSAPRCSSAAAPCRSLRLSPSAFCGSADTSPSTRLRAACAPSTPPAPPASEPPWTHRRRCRPLRVRTTVAPLWTPPAPSRVPRPWSLVPHPPSRVPRPASEPHRRLRRPCHASDVPSLPSPVPDAARRATASARRATASTANGSNDTRSEAVEASPGSPPGCPPSRCSCRRGVAPRRARRCTPSGKPLCPSSARRPEGTSATGDRPPSTARHSPPSPPRRRRPLGDVVVHTLCAEISTLIHRHSVGNGIRARAGASVDTHHWTIHRKRTDPQVFPVEAVDRAFRPSFSSTLGAHSCERTCG